MHAFNTIRHLRDHGLSDLSPTERLVLYVYVSYTNNDGQCWPSASTLARGTGLSVRAVRKTAASLRARGLLEVLRLGPGGVNVVQVHLVHPPEPGAGVGVNVVQVTPARGAPKGSKKDPGGRVPPSPKGVNLWADRIVASVREMGPATWEEHIGDLAGLLGETDIDDVRLQYDRYLSEWNPLSSLEMTDDNRAGWARRLGARSRRMHDVDQAMALALAELRSERDG